MIGSQEIVRPEMGSMRDRKQELRGLATLLRSPDEV